MYRKVLVADDEQSIREFFQILFKRISIESTDSFDVNFAKDGRSALELIKNQSFDMVISDLNMPGLSGLDLLKQVKSINPQTIFLMVTAFDTAETGVESMKQGAYDYIPKPFNVDKIKTIIISAFNTEKVSKQNQHIDKRKNTYTINLIGQSVSIKKIISDVKRIADSRANVLITGESGTGKEVIARSIHFHSSLKDKIFIPVNCGAIPEDLMESEMFGHKKGSFTGAITDKKGFFESADGGTLFLDEVGELPLRVQPKLLRVLQEKTIRMVGSVADKKVNVRLIAATNRDLQEMVQGGGFREDLFYRLNVVNIHLPPLRERKEDIPILIKHFVIQYCKKLGQPVKTFSKSLMDKLRDYNYPGNVRELENLIERVIILSGEDTVVSDAVLPVLQKSDSIKSNTSNIDPKVHLPSEGCDLEKVVSDLEKDLLNQALQKTNGSKTAAANLLGLNLRSFRYRLKKYGMGDFMDNDEDIETE